MKNMQQGRKRATSPHSNIETDNPTTSRHSSPESEPTPTIAQGYNPDTHRLELDIGVNNIKDTKTDGTKTLTVYAYLGHAGSLLLKHPKSEMDEQEFDSDLKPYWEKFELYPKFVKGSEKEKKKGIKDKLSAGKGEVVPKIKRPPEEEPVVEDSGDGARVDNASGNEDSLPEGPINQRSTGPSDSVSFEVKKKPASLSPEINPVQRAGDKLEEPGIDSELIGAVNEAFEYQEGIITELRERLKSSRQGAGKGQAGNAYSKSLKQSGDTAGLSKAAERSGGFRDGATPSGRAGPGNDSSTPLSSAESLYEE